jgi:2-polyprenyl-6-hydroxyphenyl methylase/3-demethylubiquinone-9 3-methyltransferase
MLESLDSSVGIQQVQVARGERFTFGENWTRFLELLDENRIAQAEASLKEMLEVEGLAGKRFLDIGSGSGLFSLAARRLGASVFSFDYDPQSVACTLELKRRYFPGDQDWVIEEGSALDTQYLESLQTFDIVYSWGVLHHTGEMWRALNNASIPVADGGRLFIAIYNDTGSQSARWKRIKQSYNALPRPLRVPFTVLVTAPTELRAMLGAVLRLRPRSYLKSWTGYTRNRGMSKWRDIVDWVGGYPYEFAKPDEIFDFYKSRGFVLAKLKCGGVGLGCNEFVFVKQAR